MKSRFLVGAALCLIGIFSQNNLFSDNIQDLDRNQNGLYDEGEVNPNCEYQSGPCICYCPVTTFRPRYYCTCNCVDEPYTVQRRCCRYVPQYYEKTCCRYVPQYYTQQYCCYVPEYYCVPETRCRKKYIREQHCCYEPCTYYKRTCVPCPPTSGCPTDSNTNWNNRNYDGNNN